MDDVITVGALTKGEAKWENSSIGSLQGSEGELRTWPNQKPEVSAPGYQIVSTGDNNDWYVSSGTSDATVFVSGALALVLEANPFLLENRNSADIECLSDLKMSLANSSRSLGGGEHDQFTGYGILDVGAWSTEFRLTQTCFVP